MPFTFSCIFFIKSFNIFSFSSKPFRHIFSFIDKYIGLILLILVFTKLLKLLNAIFPILVESIKGKYLVLGQGGETVKKGQRMQLILRGEKIKDSYTKESLGRSEEVIGEIEITGVTPKQSYAKVISSTKEGLESLFKPKMMLVRPFNKSQDLKKKKEDLDKKREERKKKFEEDW